MLFEPRLRNGLADGSITVAFRRWRRSQVVAGHHYRTGGGPMVEAVSVEVVEPASLRITDARRAGYGSVAALLSGLRGDDSLPLYRVAFRVLDAPDPRSELAETTALSDDERTALDKRLARLDAAAGNDGPWTHATLRLIAANPGVVSTTLAAGLDVERMAFKLRVRSLKALGLTISLTTGYELSPRGKAYLGG